MGPPPSKRRKTENVIEEVKFDDSARHDYLTGFHKRKLQRTKQAQEAAQKKARAERIEDRRKLRDDRKSELERHVQEVNSLLRLSNADSGRSADLGEGAPETESIEWKGIPEAAPKSSMDEYEAEYIDEDKYTSVTIEELAGSREGSLQADEDTSEASNRQRAINGPSTYQENAQVKRRLIGISGPAKAKRKKFRYESKTERKMSRLKVKAKNSKHAKARKSG